MSTSVPEKPLLHATQELIAGRDLSSATLEAGIGAMMDGRCSEAEIAGFLTSLACRGESANQIAGAARAMRARATQIPTTERGLLDTCGTGGDQLHTFNISTAAALVAAACGARVAKHGNRQASSSSGSADVLEALGVNVNLSPNQVAACLSEVGLGFCFARNLHAAMKHVAPVRSALGFRTIFNLLGPLTNPAGADYQVIGTNRIATAEKLAQAVLQLGTKRTLVVCGANMLDEVSLWGETAVFRIEGGSVSRDTWTAASFGLAECQVEQLRVNSPGESAKVILRVLENTPGPHRDMVIANTAAALVACGIATSPLAGAERAAAAISSGAAREVLTRLTNWQGV